MRGLASKDDVADIKNTQILEAKDVSLELLLLMLLLVLALISGVVLKKSGHKYVQEAAVTVIIGAFAGLCLKQY